MALIVCPDCGKSVSDRANSCPECGAPIADVPHGGHDRVQEVVVVPRELHAGVMLGPDTAMALWSERLAPVWFVVIWVLGALILGYRSGLLQADPVVWWYVLVTFVAPIPVAIVLHRPIRKVLPWILGGDVA